MDTLCAANEPDAGHPITPFVERFFCRRSNCRMLRQAEIIIGAEIEDRFAVGHADHCALACSDHALAFISAGRTNFLELGRDAGVESFIHKQRSKSIKPCLEEPQIFWLVDHLPAAHDLSLILTCRSRFGS